MAYNVLLRGTGAFITVVFGLLIVLNVTSAYRCYDCAGDDALRDGETFSTDLQELGSYRNKKACSDPFNTSVPVATCDNSIFQELENTVCVKEVYRRGNSWMIIRRCELMIRRDIQDWEWWRCPYWGREIDGYELYDYRCCESDLCNSSGRLTSSFLGIMTGFLVLFVRSHFW